MVAEVVDMVVDAANAVVEVVVEVVAVALVSSPSVRTQPCINYIFGVEELGSPL